MPTETRSFDLAIGPIITVSIGLPQDEAMSYFSKGMTIPARSTCSALIDTGATGIVVNPDIFAKIGTSQYIPLNAHGVGGEERVEAAYISLSVLCSDGTLLFGFPKILAIRPNHRLPEGQECLVGRSVLSKFKFRYDGRANIFELETL